MKPVRTICVFCASSDSVEEVYREAATDLGRRMGRLGIDLVYGGASIGLMGCVARAVHREGGKVVGVLPGFLREKEVAYEEADELLVPEGMRERKGIMEQKSDAFIVLPGGIGTLEEATEILSMKQLRLTHKPLVFINTGNFFSTLFQYLREMVAGKFAQKELLDQFASRPDAQRALDYIQSYQPAMIRGEGFEIR